MMDVTEREYLKNKLEFLIGKVKNKYNISSLSQMSEKKAKREEFVTNFAEWQDEGSLMEKSKIEIYYGLKAPSKAKELNIW